jgi:hypothetical protein
MKTPYVHWHAFNWHAEAPFITPNSCRCGLSTSTAVKAYVWAIGVIYPTSTIPSFFCFQYFFFFHI